MRDLRKKRGLDKVGLLAIFAINKDSDVADAPNLGAVDDDESARQQKTERVSLKAADHLIGITLMFPEARDLSDTVAYYSANVDPGDIEDVEAELKAADELDEKHALQEEVTAK